MQENTSVHELIVHKAKTKYIAQLVNPTTEKECCDDMNSAKIEQEPIYKVEIVWKNAIGMMVLHLMFIYGFYLTFTTAKIWTTIWGTIIGYSGAIGVSAGSHRLWSHRAYKATLPMRILLMLMQSMANEDCIYYWARDHRIHHKYVDTNADPYNSTRGFFFCHMGWLMLKKHPDVMKFGKGIDMSDIASDPVVAFQKKYFLILMPIMNIIIPTWIPMFFWNESFKVAFFVAVWKWVFSLHMVWAVNSVAHTWGYKPYDRFSTATDNPGLGILMLGEFWHNYHHVFPFDYTVADIPFYVFHPTAKFIEFFSLFGLTYDLKTVSSDLAMKQAERNGDGTVKKPISPN